MSIVIIAGGFMIFNIYAVNYYYSNILKLSTYPIGFDGVIVTVSILFLWGF